MPREKIVSVGNAGLTLVVKKVKGKLYVYDEYRLNGRVITNYIGPLEEMTRVYQVYKSLGKVEKLSKRDLRRLAKMIVGEIMKKINVVNSPRIHGKKYKNWCGGRDLNPGSPAWQAGTPWARNPPNSTNKLTTVMPSLPIPPVDNSLIQGFREWLLGRITPETARDYISIINKKQWPPSKRSHIRAWRNYVKYLFSIGRVTWEQLQHYNFFLKTPSSKKSGERRVEDNIIINYTEKMKKNDLTTIAILLLGGARLKHIVLMLNNFKPEEIVKHPHGEFEPRLKCFDEFCRYYLGIKLGSKRCDYIYYAKIELEKQELSYTKLKDMMNKQLGVNAKLFRKYVNQRLEELAQKHGIRLDAVNLIISRELSVTGAHYLNVRDWADKLFPIYVNYLKKKGLIDA